MRVTPGWVYCAYDTPPRPSGSSILRNGKGDQAHRKGRKFRTDSPIGCVPSHPSMAAQPTAYSSAIRVGILVYDDVEELDFVGPWEVFSVANRVRSGSFPAQRLSANRSTVRARFGMVVSSVRSLYQGPIPNILILPGGPGRRQVMT